MSSANQNKSSQFVSIGVIKKSHGIDGGVLVKPFARTPFRVGLRVWIIPPTDEVHETRIAHVEDRGSDLFIQFEGVNSLNFSKALSLKTLMVRSADLNPRVLGELRNAKEPAVDVLGYSVNDENHGDLGNVTEIIQTPANDVYVIDGPYGEVLLPVHESVVLRQDDETRHLVVRVLPGTVETSIED